MQLTIHGVEGTLTQEPFLNPEVKLFKKQVWKSEPRKSTFDEGNTVCEIRFDDSCGNGHNTFAITGRTLNSGGCIHEEIAATFPELAHLIKWHLCDSTGPIHPGNAVYFAGNRDCWGLLKDERRQIVNGRTKELSWRQVAITPEGEEIDLHMIPKYADGPQAPEATLKLEWRPWCKIGEGKERQLDLARSSAVWPEATDELMAPDLKERLEARLPALLVSFRADVEAAGLLWEPT